MPRKIKAKEDLVFNKGNDQLNNQNTSIEDLAEMLAKKIADVPVPKQKKKRLISEERKEILREQLKRGREKSMQTRSIETKSAKIALHEAPTKALTSDSSPTQPQQQHHDAHNGKLDELINQMKEITALHKSKITKEKEDEEFLEFKKPVPKSTPTIAPTPTPIPTPAPTIAPKRPYYVPLPNNFIF